eukprot:scaffold38433_cov27-Phaeocystis_antarctica.AAC.1
MGIALPGLLSTAMARQHLDLFAMWFAFGGVTQIFRMPRGRKQRFTHLRGLKATCGSEVLGTTPPPWFSS